MRRRKLWIVILAAALVLVGSTAGGLRVWYNNNLKPVSSSTESDFFTVDPGSGVHEIAVNLKNNGLIRSIGAFETYVRTNGYHNKLQAGTYLFSPSMSSQMIVGKMVEGDVSKDLVKIIPGQRLDQIKQAFVKAGFGFTEINNALNPANYKGHPALADLPKGASLEGYLYPDFYQKQANTPATTIIKLSLDEMAKYLTKDIINGFKARNLNVHQGITLASIIIKEMDQAEGQPIVAQVLLTRLTNNMALQADATAFYATDISGKPRSLSVDSPYNTYLYPGLPPGPISNITKEALYAAAHPATTDYLYYVTGDDGKTHFSRTIDEHNEAVQKFCKERCKL